jgi:hypothetical protein
LIPFPFHQEPQILAGIGLGQWMPAPFQFLGWLEIARVNIPVGLLIWVMIIPMLIKIDFGALHQVRSPWKGIGVTLFVNWAVKPFSMALLAWHLIRGLFAPWRRSADRGAGDAARRAGGEPHQGLVVRADDSRQQVTLPPPMQAHMLANMRDHLVTLETITQQLAAGEFEAASVMAEQRLGMSAM